MIMSRAIVRSVVAIALLGGEALAAGHGPAASPPAFEQGVHGVQAVNTVVTLKKFEGLSQESD
jgi:hypothetical protein